MIKDWIIILGSLLILAIVIDGIRRKRNDRYGKIRMSPAMRKRAKLMEAQELEKQEPPPSFISELPNGGARVIGKRDESEIVQGLLKSTRSKLPKHQQQTDVQSALQKVGHTPEQTQLNLDEAVPLLMESVTDMGHSNQRIEPHFTEELHGNNDNEYPSDEYEGEDFDNDDHPYEREIEDDYQDDEDDDYHDQDDDALNDEDESTEDNNSSENRNILREPDEVFILHVMANKEQQFKGNELLDTVLQCGMRFGEMDIFHRYTDTRGQGAPLFSMANIMKPGTFDLDAMDEFTTPGISFFMTLPIEADSLKTFELMLDTARAVAGTLDGEIRDDQRSIMTKQTLEHCRERIRDYERQRLFRRPR